MRASLPSGTACCWRENASKISCAGRLLCRFLARPSLYFYVLSRASLRAFAYSACSPNFEGLPNEGPAVIAQLFDRLVDVGERLVPALFRNAFQQIGLPAARELLQRRDIEIAVMKVVFERWHCPRKKASILTDRIAAHRRHLGRNVLAQECERRSLDGKLSERRRLHLVDETALAVRALVPRIHCGKHRVV